MAKIEWDKFVKLYPKSPAFSAAVSRSLPKGLQFDKNRKTLPTPYGLFVEWLTQTLTGNWASATVPGGFVVGIEIKNDMEKILAKYPAISTVKKTPASEKTVQIAYGDRYYVVLAKELGYKIDVKKLR